MERGAFTNLFSCPLMFHAARMLPHVSNALGIEDQGPDERAQQRTWNGYIGLIAWEGQSSSQRGVVELSILGNTSLAQLCNTSVVDSAIQFFSDKSTAKYGIHKHTSQPKFQRCAPAVRSLCRSRDTLGPIV